MALDVGVGLALLAALIAVIVLFARFIGPRIIRSTKRVVSGRADASDVLPAVLVATVFTAGDAGGCDAGGGGGCD